MNVSLEGIDGISALLTVKVEKADYQEQVDTSLKTLRRQIQLPGFRKGMAPMSLIWKKYGKSTVVEEINKLLQKEINRYLEENKINLLVDPMPSEKQAEIDYNTMGDFEFVFDIAVAPELEPEITASDEVDYYTIDVTDEMVDKQVEIYAQQRGKYEQVDSYREEDMVRGLITELDENGNIKDGGICVENAVIMPVYIHDDAQKALFNDAKVNDVLVFNPNKAYGGHEVEISSLLQIDKSAVAELTSDFSFRVGEITRFVESELNQELFDQIFGEGEVKSEEEFRAKVKESYIDSFKPYSEYKFMADIRKMLIGKVGELSCDEASLKRLLIRGNRDNSSESVDGDFKEILADVKWRLIKGKLVRKYGFNIEESDVINMAGEMVRTRYARYGILNVSDENIKRHAEEMLGQSENVTKIVDRVLDMKLADGLKEKIKLNLKTVPYEEFVRLFE
jgi:trigger factor